MKVEEFKAYSDKVDFYFADDGSQDETSSFLKQHGFNVFRSEKNLGKGHILYQTFHEIKNKLDLASYEWIGYWDADLTIPLSTIEQMLAEDLRPFQAVWSSRQRHLALKYDEKLSRRVTGRGFAYFIKLVFNPTVYDTQCGAKLFRSTVLPKIFHTSFLSRWLFDIEIYLRMEKDTIKEWPLSSWSEHGLSRIQLSKEVIPVFYDILQIFWNYRVRKSHQFRLKD